MKPPSGQLHIESTPKRVRVLFNGTFVVDTCEARLVWEKPYYPVYFFGHQDLPEKYLQSTGSGSSDEGTVYNLVVGSRHAPSSVVKYDGDHALAGLLKIMFGAMDAWFEEEEEVFVHPKDPYKRVDVLQSAREVRVEVNGIEVARTVKPKLLFETSLPVRTYIPKTDCRLDLLVPSALTTQCPYKGVANYYDVHLPDGQTIRDVVWWYRAPLPECESIKGYVAFYDEKVDVWVDGKKQART
ncbi:hypothetical protein PLICRDRAFT_116610 [Plicaturopsis crispa FD-325 SS-3]|uniref:DUF427 domain-containing protein n=1 Tax=Plicaturopsis crispa FD-325 SS-3 TaxID=944288 RepID=A0A0C9T7B5_PLICR|nr:hypothetical protein PLICRDRAFT_116610 [Plicaturopsis crispa FD-325 SS-3]